MNKGHDFDLKTELVKAWYARTITFIDLDNGGRIINPPLVKDWVVGVVEDLNKHFVFKKDITQSRNAVIDEVLEILRSNRAFDGDTALTDSIIAIKALKTSNKVERKSDE